MTKKGWLRIIRSKLRIKYRLFLILEIITFPITFLIGLYLRVLTKVEPLVLQRSYKWFSSCGFLPVRFHYYQPIIKKEMLPKNYSTKVLSLPGIDLDINNQLKTLKNFHYNDELKSIPIEGYDLDHSTGMVILSAEMRKYFTV